VGLKQVAEDTGGFYMRTPTSPACDRAAEHALVGYYTIAFEKPPLLAGNTSSRSSPRAARAGRSWADGNA
jgi:hypothetical protein